MSSPRRNAKGLTDKEMRFCHEYDSNGMNGTDAYMAVWSNVGYNTARSHASALVAKSNVQEYLKELQNKAFTELGISRKNTLRHLAEIGYCITKRSKTFRKDVKELGTICTGALDKLAKAQKLYQPEMEVPDQNINTEGGDVYIGPVLMMPRKG